MKYSQDLVRSIFFASDQNHRVDEQTIADVCFLLSENLLNFSRQKIASKDIYHQYLDDLESGKIKKFTIEGGGNGHLALKLIGQDFLHGQGYHDLKFEQELAGYRPDIMTLDGKIIVECGNTNPDKIFQYFNPFCCVFDFWVELYSKNVFILYKCKRNAI